MSDMPEGPRVIHAEGVCDGEDSYGAWYGSDQGDTTPYTRSDLVPTWNRDLSAAQAGESVILATSGGHVGEAFAPSESGLAWVWCDTGCGIRSTPIAWQPLPRHPDEEAAAGSENGGGG